MDRRQFLAGVAANAVAGPAAVDESVEMIGLGLARLKTEGMTVAYDPGFCKLSELRELLLPGLWEVTSAYPLEPWSDVVATAWASEDQS